MKVEVIGIRLLNGDKPLRAFADIKFEDSICDKGVSGHQGERETSPGSAATAFLEGFRRLN